MTPNFEINNTFYVRETESGAYVLFFNDWLTGKEFEPVTHECGICRIDVEDYDSSFVKELKSGSNEWMDGRDIFYCKFPSTGYLLAEHLVQSNVFVPCGEL